MINSKRKEVINSVWLVYGHYSGNFLEELPVLESPWISVKKDLRLKQSTSDKIDVDKIKEYFMQELAEIRNMEDKNE
ncbi:MULTISPECIES: Panacea domain-containing protein [Bacillus]|uniref:Uncharacterized protein n=2 Tax=Bacillus thuringiensis TaxID=1428 RepID=A0AAP4Q665_BACTU|nr:MULTISPECIES: hypothetical protein [Bacillus]MEC0046508.1 hypothetical protein [Bacillus cereus]AFV21876.1 hypothetical protein BTB_502p05710 [Bacillus thuringiensis Bt407]EEM25098.1 Cdse [Bacillus thuringiensis Bt407]ERI00946.1 putative phage-associated protein [Bacillus thuringiensis T01-328]MBN6707712.1 hypothetical protein [Bacillus thuringiensis]